jgi:predicted kinase
VLDLARRLIADGFRVSLDQLAKRPQKTWREWAADQMESAKFVLVVCTETYRCRAEGKEKPGEGLGAAYEARLIYQNCTIPRG